MSTGYPDDNPKTQFGLAKTPMHLVPPAAIRGLARAFANGATKYGPFNWREKKISSTVYYAAALRHLTDWYDRIDAEDKAPDSGVHHLEHAMACLAMILDTKDSELLNDDRPIAVNRDAAPLVSGRYGYPGDVLAISPSTGLNLYWPQGKEGDTFYWRGVRYRMRGLCWVRE